MEYNFAQFDIQGQLSKELADFFGTSIKVGGTKYHQKKGYQFNQFDTIQAVEFVGASQFLEGDKDSEGQQKMYLNSSTFRSAVASKNIDIDVKDIVFVPDDSHSDIPCKITRKMFKRYAKDNGLGERLNEMVDRFPFYGSLVLKNIKGKFEIVPLSKIRNQQDAKNLNTASYVIIEHTMKYWEASEMPDWDLSGLECKWDDDITVMERYGRVPMRFFDKKAEEYESVDTVSYIAYDKRGKKEDSALLFIEKIDERPFQEVHWERRDGRWLGVGEIEKNFENQKARNYVFNLRMRSAMWSAKTVFQSTDETVAKNLVSEVRDGDVLTILPNGNLTPVNTQTRAISDYNSIDQVVEDNSNQNAFTFEVATGESLPSGTPFRLGVVLANSVNSHFNKKREQLALFIKRWLYDDVLPTFINSIEDGKIEFFGEGDEAYTELVDDVAKVRLNKYIKDSVLKKGIVPSKQEQDLYKSQVLSLKGFDIKVIKKSLTNLKYSVDIVITGESVDLPKKIETLTNLYQALAQAQNPNAEQVLARIIALTGEKMPPSAPQQATMPEVPNAPVNEVATV
jgi:hypothetical protein